MDTLLSDGSQDHALPASPQPRKWAIQEGAPGWGRAHPERGLEIRDVRLQPEWPGRLCEKIRMHSDVIEAMVNRHGQELINALSGAVAAFAEAEKKRTPPAAPQATAEEEKKP